MIEISWTINGKSHKQKVSSAIAGDQIAKSKRCGGAKAVQVTDKVTIDRKLHIITKRF